MEQYQKLKKENEDLKETNRLLRAQLNFQRKIIERFINEAKMYQTFVDQTIKDYTGTIID